MGVDPTLTLGRPHRRRHQRAPVAGARARHHALGARGVRVHQGAEGGAQLGRLL